MYLFIGNMCLVRGSHLFVLVHGFQGNPFDMRIFKACIAQMLPDALFLSSGAN